MSVSQPLSQECPLTPAELRVLELLMDGLNYEEIAHALGRATSTVRSQLHNAYRRLGVSTSYQAVLECVRVGWLTWSDDDSETAVLMRVEDLLRHLIRAVETHREHTELTPTQREYLEAFDEHLHARSLTEQRSTRAQMDQALEAVLSDATVPARLHSRDVIGDLGTLIDIHAEWVAA